MLLGTNIMNSMKAWLEPMKLELVVADGGGGGIDVAISNADAMPEVATKRGTAM